MAPGGKVKIIRNKEKWKHKDMNKSKGYLLHKTTEGVCPVEFTRKERIRPYDHKGS